MDGEPSLNARKLLAEVVGPLDDAELVRRIRGGETALFELVMRRYNQRLFRLLRSLLRDEAEAEDVLQDAYVRAYAHLGQLEQPERLASWLTHIAVHEAKARLRRRGRFADVKEGPLRAVPSPSSDPEQETLGKQLQRVLVSAIDDLPVGYRTVFVLRDVEGMSIAAGQPPCRPSHSPATAATGSWPASSPGSSSPRPEARLRTGRDQGPRDRVAVRPERAGAARASRRERASSSLCAPPRSRRRPAAAQAARNAPIRRPPAR